MHSRVESRKNPPHQKILSEINLTIASFLCKLNAEKQEIHFHAFWRKFRESNVFSIQEIEKLI